MKEFMFIIRNNNTNFPHFLQATKSSFCKNVKTILRA